MADLETQNRRESSKSIVESVRKAVAIGAPLLAMASFNAEADGALRPDGTDRQPYVDRANPYLAVNGGPAVTVAISSPLYETVPDTGLIKGGRLILSGTLLGINKDGMPVLGMSAHGLGYFIRPQDITSLTVYTGANFQSAPGQVIAGDLSTLKVNPEWDYNKTDNENRAVTIDMAGITLTQKIPNMGKFTFGKAQAGEVITSVGNGFSFTPSEYQSGVVNANLNAYRDASFMASQNIVESIAPGDANPSLYGSSDASFGGLAPTYVARINQGDSNSTEIIGEVIDNGILKSGTIAGIGVAYTGGNGQIGQNIFVETISPQFTEFSNSLGVVVPEPTSGTILMGLASAAILRRNRKTT